MVSYRPLNVINYLSLFGLALFCSCYSPRYVYSPSTQNIPQLIKKGDAAAAGYFATGGGSSRLNYAGTLKYNLGLDLHTSYAFTDHLAIMLNKYNRWERNSGANDFAYGDNGTVSYKRALTELATGYFAPLKKGSHTSFFQVFTGVAFGKFKIDDNSVANGLPFHSFHYSQITKIFIQPALTVGPRQNISAAFSSRFSEVFYHKISTNYTKDDLDNYLLNDLSSPVFFWEPAMNFSFGFKEIKGIKVSFQSGLAILINRRFVDYRTINIAFGIIANNDLFKRIKK